MYVQCAYIGYLHIFLSAFKNGCARFLSGSDPSFSLSLLFIFFSLICCRNVTQNTHVKRVYEKSQDYLDVTRVG